MKVIRYTARVEVNIPVANDYDKVSRALAETLILEGAEIPRVRIDDISTYLTDTDNQTD
jgi:hypothetical protein